jgi:hypothetical protein
MIENIAYILVLILQKGGRNSTEKVRAFIVIETYVLLARTRIPLSDTSVMAYDC